MTRRRFVAGAAAAVLVLAVAGIATVALVGTPPATLPEPVDYLALGDSTATGTGAETGYPVRYRERLAEATDAPVELTNLARDGATTADLLTTVREDPRARSAIEDADLITVSIGGNDLLGALRQLLTGTCPGFVCLEETTAAFRTNWDMIIGELGGASDARLVATDLYNPFAGTLQVFGVLHRVQPALDRINDHIAGTEAVEVAVISEAFNGADGSRDPVARGLISSDRVHPSDEGHALIAELLPIP